LEKIKLSENAEKVAESRYFNEGEDWEKCIRRVSKEIASNEKNKDYYEEKFFDMIYNMKMLPGGRILRNTGRKKGNLLNCFVLPINDSIESIGQFISDALTIWSSGGGVGANFSKLRPKGDPILGKGGQSSGVVSFLQAIDAVSRTIESGGQRRAASLACLQISHPEIIDFINAKTTDGKLSNFNISVLINDEFLCAVENDKLWNLQFNGKIYKEVWARDLWKLILDNMINHAEPGLLYENNLMDNNSSYFEEIEATNPCGEIPLSKNSVCCLGSIVLTNFLDIDGNTKWDELKETIELSVRFLDDVLDVNCYIFDKIEDKAKDSRRIGLGILGLAEYMFAKKVRYGSEDSINEVSLLMEFIRDTSYEMGINLSIEKGSFKKFDSEKYLKSTFVRKLPKIIKDKIRKYGIRNVTYLTCPPTGTTSLLAETTSGIESLVFKSYKRNDRVGERVYIHPLYKKLLLSGDEIPDWFVDIDDLKPEDHLQIQKTLQKYVDSSISKTINFSNKINCSELSIVLLKFIRDLKGVTIYVNNSRDGQVYNKLSEEEAMDYILNEELKINDDLSEDDIKCGLCENKGG